MHSQHTGFEAPTIASQKTWFLEEKQHCLAVERLEQESQVEGERGAEESLTVIPSRRINYSLFQDLFRKATQDGKKVA